MNWKRHLNERKPKALDDEISVTDGDAAEEHDVSCSSDSESDEDEKTEYAKCKVPCVCTSLYVFFSIISKLYTACTFYLLFSFLKILISLITVCFLVALEEARTLLSMSRVTGDNEVAYPDTFVDMSISSSTNRIKTASTNDDETYIIIGDVPSSVTTQKEVKKQIVLKSKQSSKTVPAPEVEEVAKSHQATTKRGQKGKIKKIKEKYKDQDEDERQLKMELLQVHDNKFIYERKM